MASLVLGFTDSNKNNTCPAITGLQLSACNTDCGRVEASCNQTPSCKCIVEESRLMGVSQVSLAGGDWRGVCSSNWTEKEATVVCRN